MDIDDTRANGEIVADRRRRRFPRPGKRFAIVVAALVAVAVIVAGGAAFATYDYSNQYAGRILPGSRIAGVNVGGMGPQAALAAVKAEIEPQLTRTITIRWKGKTWKVTPKQLGARSDAEDAVGAAIHASRAATFMDKLKMRWFGRRLGFRRDIAIDYPRKEVKGFVRGIAAGIDLKPRDASLDYSSGWVEIRKDRLGRKVLAGKSRWRLMQALRNGHSEVELAVKKLEPTTTVNDYDQVLLVRIGENKLYLYENGRITRSWPVATGQPEYMTPTGVYEVTLKRYMPTWVNPDPDGWGSNMPDSIPPGPGNPLGVRALNWSAPAIRFHGTQATYSLGYNASHGCVRLSNPDAIELYNLVDVGTPIVSLVAGQLKPLYAPAPDPTLVRSDEGKKKPDSGGSGRRKGDN